VIAQRLRNYFSLSSSESNPEQAKLFWIVRLRWLVIGFLIALAPFGYALGVLHRYTIGVYTGVIAILFIFNLLTQWMWFERQRLVSPTLVGFQLTIDLIVLTGILILTGGLTNPFYILLFVNTSLGATLLEGRRSFIFLLLCHQALFLVQLFTLFFDELFRTFNVDTHLTVSLIVQHVVLLIAWAVSRTLGDYISTQQKRLLQVKLHAEKLDRLRALGSMTAGFSHEFASPLNTVKLRLDRELRAQPDSGNLKEMKLAIYECEAVLKQMNNSQLDPRDFEFKRYQVNKLILEITQSWQNENPQAEVVTELSNTLQTAKLPVVNFSQALINLLDNAYEATPDAAICVQTITDENHLILSVTNEGSTFSQDVLDRFGEPFLTTKTSGTGLGLYSVQLFALSIGGKAFLRNLSDRSARVEIHIPLADLNNLQEELL